MKKYLGLVFITLFVVGCSQPKAPEKANAPKHPATNQTTNVEGSAQLSLDWAGTYDGVLPCADCAGIKTRLTLNTDHTYILEEQYLTSKNTTSTVYKGAFVFDKNNKSLIKLDAKADNRVFFIGENFVELRNKQTGAVISNNLPYKLTKII